MVWLTVRGWVMHCISESPHKARSVFVCVFDFPVFSVQK